jgi:hypothetical protein
MRWTRAGVNVADLTDMANEMAAGHSLPGIRNEVLFLKAREDHEELLRRALSRMATSMGKGLPPVISLRRFALRGKGGEADWQLMDAHFVTVISVPKKVERGARSFAVSYVAPWGGKREFLGSRRRRRVWRHCFRMRRWGRSWCGRGRRRC